MREHETSPKALRDIRYSALPCLGPARLSFATIHFVHLCSHSVARMDGWTVRWRCRSLVSRRETTTLWPSEIITESVKPPSKAIVCGRLRLESVTQPYTGMGSTYTSSTGARITHNTLRGEPPTPILTLACSRCRFGERKEHYFPICGERELIPCFLHTYLLVRTQPGAGCHTRYIYDKVS